MVEFYRETEFKEETGIGRIPKDWRIVRFKNILKEVDLRGKDIGDAEKLPVLSLTKDFGLIPQEQRFHKRVAADDTSNYKVVKRGWLVYNPYVIWEGAICVLRDIEMGLVSPVYPVWEPTADVDYHFLHYLIRTKRMLSTFFRLATGVVQRRRSLKKKDFLEILIPLPPLEEQKLIARILYSMDEAIRAVDDSIAKWERLKKGLMQELLTKGIGHKEFKEEAGIGRIPASWKAARLIDVADYINGYPFSTKDWKDHGLPIIRIQNLNDPDAEFNYFDGDIDSKYIVNDGDILFSWSGSIGVYLWNRGKAVLNQHIFKVIPRQGVDRIYLYYALHMAVEQLKRRVHGSTMKHFRRGELKTTYIPLPPLEEQKRIAKILSSVDAVIEEKRRKKARLERMKKALMNLLLTGKIRVRSD